MTQNDKTIKPQVKFSVTVCEMIQIEKKKKKVETNKQTKRHNQTATILITHSR